MKMLTWLCVAGLLTSCASTGKPAHIPSKMLPHHGMTSSRAAGFGKAAVFMK